MAEDRPASPFVVMSARQRTVIVLAFAAYLLLVLIARTRDPSPTDDLIPVYLVGYVALLAAPLLVLRGSRGWLHPLVFLSLFGLVDLLRRFAMYAWGLDWHRALPLGADELSHLIEYQLLLQSIALVSMYVGFAFAPRLPVPRVTFGQPRLLVPKLLVVWGVALVAFALYIASQGGLDAHIARWSGGRAEQLAGQQYQIALANLGVPACWIWLAYRPGALRSPLFWAVAGTSLALTFLGSGSRSATVYAALVGLMVWMLRERRVMFLRALAVGVVSIYLIEALGTFRRSGWSGKADWEAATEGPVVDTIISGAQGELSSRLTNQDGALPILARVPDDVPLMHGSSYLAVVTLPVPRVLWPDKPGLAPGRVGQTFFGMPIGVPPGAVGEAYWNFHIAGVIGVFFLFGAFLAWLARVFSRYADAAGALPLYAMTLFLFREPSGLAFVTWLIMLVPSLLILMAAGGLRVGRPARRLGRWTPVAGRSA